MFFVIGFLLCAAPLVLGLIAGLEQKSVFSSFNQTVSASENTAEEALKNADEYNTRLWQAQGAIVGNADAEFYSDENYESQLNLAGTGLMGSISIPKINISLPIYHGTDDEVLSKGVGHLQGSSLPVGGENSRSVLTAHRGLPNSKLFTRLDELETGDLIFLDISSRKLAYEVENIEVIDPEDMDKLQTVGGKDLITLVTCTPYGINTHRLLVTAHQVPYSEMAAQAVMPAPPSWRELIFASLPFIFIFIGLYRPIKDFFHKRKERTYE